MRDASRILVRKPEKEPGRCWCTRQKYTQMEHIAAYELNLPDPGEVPSASFSEYGHEHSTSIRGREFF
jgi:hypothetical protein